MNKRLIFAILLFMLGVLVYVCFAEGKTENEEIIPVVMVEVKKDTPVKEFYDTNSLIRAQMFYDGFLKRFAKANNMAEGGFNVLQVGIYYIPIDGVFFKNTETEIYPAMVINAEPGMTLSEFYKTNSLVNRKLSWGFFKKRFAEFQEILNEEKEFRKLKPGVWIMPVANVFFWTPQEIKLPLEMAFKQVKGNLYSAKLQKTPITFIDSVKEYLLKKIHWFTPLIILLIAAVALAMIDECLRKRE